MNQTQKISQYLRYTWSWFTSVWQLKRTLWIKNVTARMHDVERDLLKHWYILNKHKITTFPFKVYYFTTKVSIKMSIKEKVLFRLEKLLCKIRNQK